jgi:hypothetical protein
MAGKISLMSHTKHKQRIAGMNFKSIYLARNMERVKRY